MSAGGTAGTGSGSGRLSAATRKALGAVTACSNTISRGLRTLRKLRSCSETLAAAQRTRVGTSQCDVVYQSGTHRLLRYRRASPALWAQPVLICYALINRPYILDLQPEKSVVRQLLAGGFDVYMIDWGTPSHADRFLTLEHYVCGFLAASVEVILRTHGGETLHLLGYCMGGTMAAIFSALNPDAVQSLTLLAAPIDFSGRESLLNVWTDPACFDVDAFLDAQGNCPAWFLQLCFQNTRPIQNSLEKNLSLFANIEDPRFLANYYAMELWVNDNIPMAGETFRQFVKDLYQNNRLARNELRVGSRRVDLGRITCPLMLLMAKNDHLVPPASTQGILPHVRGTDVESVLVEAGHVGLVVGGKAQRSTWPMATRWLADRSTSSEKQAS